MLLMTGSEIADFRQQQALQEQAARLGLSGLASGVSRHDVIEARMNQDLERFVELAREGRIEQIEREIELMQKELKIEKRVQ
jgi:hypothetical protein